MPIKVIKADQPEGISAEDLKAGRVYEVVTDDPEDYAIVIAIRSSHMFQVMSAEVTPLPDGLHVSVPVDTFETGNGVVAVSTDGYCVLACSSLRFREINAELHIKGI